VMAAPIISISSDSSEESVGSHALRVILFGVIPSIILEVPIVLADPIVMSHPAKAETQGVNKNGYHHNTWSLIKYSLLTSRNAFSERQSLMRQTSPRVQDVKGDMDSTEFSRSQTKEGVILDIPVMVTTRRNSDDDVPNFEAMITAAVANALPNLTAALRTQITNDIRNGAGPSGGGGGDAIPQ
ncbi:hypothetical protein Tco_0425552, partial [Tanacetum coccineum]